MVSPRPCLAGEAHIDDVCKAIGADPIDFRRSHVMPQGYVDGFSKNENYYDTFNQVMDKGPHAFRLPPQAKGIRQPDRPGPTGRGYGALLVQHRRVAHLLESSSCRMVLNQDGSIQMQTGETEIGQGCDTAFAQMAAEALGIPVEDVHRPVSTQDTDVTPFGTGAYASRQTYIGGVAIKQTAMLLKERILRYAKELTRQEVSLLDLRDGKIVGPPTAGS